MDKFQESFINEARELMVDLEASLLALEENMKDLVQVEGVFRVMHTLKGAANMFGFDNIGVITHDLETIFDKIRNQEALLNRNILDVSLETLDLINQILDTPSSDFSNLQNKILHKISSLLNEQESIKKDVDVSEVKEGNDVSAVQRTYYLSFSPKKGLLKNGSNPFFLIEDLLELGMCTVKCNSIGIPLLGAYDPLCCYLSWQFILVSSCTLEEINDVFIFVEDECVLELEEIFKGNIFEITSVKEYLSGIEGMALINPDEIKTRVKEFESERNNEESHIKSSKKKEFSIRVSSEKIDELMNIVSQMVTAQAGLELYAEKHKNSEIEVLTEQIGKLSRKLRDSAFGMSLVPLDSILVRFKRLIRDISKDIGKDVDFQVEGGGTELDKNIIEGISDPLMHILRNSVDHGLETKEERLESGKDLVGKVTLRAYYSGASVNIEVQDDGRGIDPQKIWTKAIEKGIIKEDVNLSDQEIYNLLFASGFSTADKVTDISGRGVGMDVVKKNITDLRGEILIDSKLGKGSTFTLKLPLTLSIIDGLLVKVSGANFVIPLDVIKKCHETFPGELLNNVNSFLIIDGEQVPYLLLNKEFGVAKISDHVLQTIVVMSNDKNVGIIVEEIVGEIQAVIKPLGSYYREQDFFSGTTILGDGSVALVIDTNRMVQKKIDKTVEI